MSWDPRIYKSTQPTHPLCHCPLSSNPSSQIKAEPKCPYFGDNLLIWSRDRITNDNGATNPSPSPTLRDDATHLHAKLTLKTLKHIFIYLIYIIITALIVWLSINHNHLNNKFMILLRPDFVQFYGISYLLIMKGTYCHWLTRMSHIAPRCNTE